MRDRVILHCDCNSFFASVETALNPEFRNVPMAVCGSQEERHGIVLAKNELAKSYGIKTADTVYSAKRACPELLIARPHYDKYVEFSERVNRIYREYTDLVEPFGIDESWLDVTASERVFGSGTRIAEEIRRRIREEIGITVSIGVSFNKVFAKLGSDYKKPDAVTVIDRKNYTRLVYPLPVGDLLFVGRRSIEELSRYGIRTIGELAGAPPNFLCEKMGKFGDMIYRYARGEDYSRVTPPSDDAKSIGNGFTFKHDLVKFEEIKSGVDLLSEEIGRRLRRHSRQATTISVSIKDEYMRVVQRQSTLDNPTDIGREISDAAMRIIKDFWASGKPIRSITVTAQNLSDSDTSAEQIDMFESQAARNTREKVRRGEVVVDEIKRRFGSEAICKAADMDEEVGSFEPKT